MTSLRRLVIKANNSKPITFAYRVAANSGSPPLPLAVRVLLCAKNFIVAGWKLGAKVDGQDHLKSLPTQPVVTMYTLAIELSLKAIAQHENGSYTQCHDLLRLYGQISQSSMMNIKQAYEESYEYYFPRSARLKVEEELARKNESVRLYYSFDDLLDLISSYFVKSRYDFDDDISEYVEFPVEVLAECVYGYASHLLGDLDMFKTPDIP